MLIASINAETNLRPAFRRFAATIFHAPATLPAKAPAARTTTPAMQAVQLAGGKHAAGMPLLHGRSAPRVGKCKALPIKAVAEVAEVEAPPMAAAGRVRLGSSDLQVSGM